MFELEFVAHGTLLIIFWFLTLIVLYVRVRKRKLLYEKLYPTAELSAEDAKDLCYQIIKMLRGKSTLLYESVETEVTLSKYAGVINNHIRFCNIEECDCRKIQLGEKNSDAQILSFDLIELSKNSQNGYLQAKFKGLDQHMCEVLNATLRHMSRSEDTGEKEILQSYVDYFMMDRVFRALHDMMMAEEHQLTLFQQLQLFCLKFRSRILGRKTIESRMIEEEARNTSNIRESFAKVVSFNKDYMGLHDLIAETIALYIRYWHEFIKPYPSTSAPTRRTQRHSPSRLLHLQQLQSHGGNSAATCCDQRRRY